MSFFDDADPVAPVDPREETREEPARAAQPEWWGPPDTVVGALVAVEQVVQRTSNAVVILAGGRAYPTGFQFEVKLAARRDGLADSAWWDLHDGLFGIHRRRWRRGPDAEAAPRFRVRFADGTEVPAGAADQSGQSNSAGPSSAGQPAAAGPAPAGPVLVSNPAGGGADNHAIDSSFQLWLWPLPPAEGFELIVEWPVAGIDRGAASLDGELIAAAAKRAEPYWPTEPETASP